METNRLAHIYRLSVYFYIFFLFLSHTNKMWSRQAVQKYTKKITKSYFKSSINVWKRLTSRTWLLVAQIAHFCDLSQRRFHLIRISLIRQTEKTVDVRAAVICLPFIPSSLISIRWFFIAMFSCVVVCTIYDEIMMFSTPIFVTSVVAVSYSMKIACTQIISFCENDETNDENHKIITTTTTKLKKFEKLQLLLHKSKKCKRCSSFYFYTFIIIFFIFPRYNHLIQLRFWALVHKWLLKLLLLLLLSL